MDYTDLIKNIKNKLKKHQQKIDSINKTIDLETKIKNDLETNFNERVEFNLVKSAASKEFIDVSNDLEDYKQKFNKNKDYGLKSMIDKLKIKREEKLKAYEVKKRQITNELQQKIQKLGKTLDDLSNDIDKRMIGKQHDMMI